MISLSHLPNVHARDGASNADLDEAERCLGCVLPDAFRDVLRASNGLDTDEGAILYGTDEIAERNETWGVRAACPDLLAIGDDSGGMVFVMAAKREAREVKQAGVGDLNDRAVVHMDVVAWVAEGCPLEDEDEEDWSRLVDLVLTQRPPGGLKQLINIRAELGIELGPQQLKSAMASTPVCLLRNVPYGQYRGKLEKLGALAACLQLVDPAD